MARQWMSCLKNLAEFKKEMLFMVAEILNDVLKYKIIAIIRGIPSSAIVSTVEAIFIAA